MQLNVVRVDKSITHVAILGRLDVEGVNNIQDKFVFATTSRRKAALVDVSQVTFIASLGMGMLISVAKTLQRQGMKMVLIAPANDMVQKALEAAGIYTVIPVAHAEAEALQLLE